MTILLAVALLPPLFLMYEVYHMDKVDKEPKGLILKLFLLGVAITIPASFVENALDGLIMSLLYVSRPVYLLVENFIGVALVEEGFKYLVLKKGSWKHPAFNYTFDGIVYAVAVSIGFAALENLLYVFQYGMTTALVRAVTSIPGHCIFAIYMGVGFSLAKKAESLGNIAEMNMQLRHAILIPTILHGFYDYSASMGNSLWTIIFLVFIIVLDVMAIRKIRKMERQDERISAAGSGNYGGWDGQSPMDYSGWMAGSMGNVDGRVPSDDAVPAENRDGRIQPRDAEVNENPDDRYRTEEPVRMENPFEK